MEYKIKVNQKKGSETDRERKVKKQTRREDEERDFADRKSKASQVATTLKI